jgi:hypothetical protein
VVPLRLVAETPRLGGRALRLLHSLAPELVGDVLGAPQERGSSTFGALRTDVGPLPSGDLLAHDPIVSGVHG